MHRERLAEITREVVDFYNANAPERSVPRFLQLTDEQLAQFRPIWDFPDEVAFLQKLP